MGKETSLACKGHMCGVIRPFIACSPSFAAVHLDSCIPVHINVHINFHVHHPERRTFESHKRLRLDIRRSAVISDSLSATAQPHTQAKPDTQEVGVLEGKEKSKTTADASYSCRPCKSALFYLVCPRQYQRESQLLVKVRTSASCAKCCKCAHGVLGALTEWDLTQTGLAADCRIHLPRPKAW